MDLLEKILSKTAEVSVIGLGYIGIPTAVFAAEAGYDIYGVDLKEDVVKKINNRVLDIKEPGLKELLEKNIKNGKIKAFLSYKESDIFIICVPTPLSNKKADLSYVRKAGESISKVLKNDNLVILESTVPPKTTEEVLIPILERSGLKNDEDFLTAFCPERVLPGRIMEEMTNNDRIIGGSEKSRKITAEFYKNFVRGKIYITDLKTAEIAKLMENTFRNVNIALANELALACENLEINFFEARKLANKHPRVNIHEAGTGVGGHCIPIDPWFIHEKFPLKTISTAMEINETMPLHVVDIIKKTNAKKILIFGMAYKKNTDDTRETPVLKIIEELKKENIEFSIYDPYVKMEKLNPENCDALLIATDHDCFKNMDWEEIRRKMRRHVIIDGRNFFEKEEAEKMGFEYMGVGK
ncbi:UDP-N-acetyl-D-mannosamine dehydrogenase [Thermococci archaeon]|nr:MAG: UDP-N-acetyl-D-mannosamine dehydrogenase [Thermococci archaeon]